MEVIAKIVVLMAIGIGITSVLAQLFLFLLGSFHVTAGFEQAFVAVALLQALDAWRDAMRAAS